VCSSDLLTKALTKALTTPLPAALDPTRTTAMNDHGGELASASGEFLALAAAAAATGDPAFREGAEPRFTRLAASGEPAAPPLPSTENWHRLAALAQAARWLDRPDWAAVALQQLAAAREQATEALAAAGSTTARATQAATRAAAQAAALAATLAGLELHWSAAAFEFACAAADAFCSTIARDETPPAGIADGAIPSR